jgi:hypothetical protein
MTKVAEHGRVSVVVADSRSSTGFQRIFNRSLPFLTNASQAIRIIPQAIHRVIHNVDPEVTLLP